MNSSTTTLWFLDFPGYTININGKEEDEENVDNYKFHARYYDKLIHVLLNNNIMSKLNNR